MNLLLDTHTFLWWNEGVLATRVAQRIQAADKVFVSVASAWEIAIKTALGKLDARARFPQAVAQYGFEELKIGFAHTELIQSLPLIHRDPFDRILVAQAIVEGLTLVTRDPLVVAYGVPSVWD